MSSTPPDPFGNVAPVSTGGRSGYAVAALVLGIIGLLSSWCLIGVVPAILGIVFGAIARRETSGPNATKTGDGIALAGLICGIVGVVILAVLIGIGLATD